MTTAAAAAASTATRGDCFCYWLCFISQAAKNILSHCINELLYFSATCHYVASLVVGIMRSEFQMRRSSIVTLTLARTSWNGKSGNAASEKNASMPSLATVVYSINFCLSTFLARRSQAARLHIGVCSTSHYMRAWSLIFVCSGLGCIFNGILRARNEMKRKLKVKRKGQCKRHPRKAI